MSAENLDKCLAVWAEMAAAEARFAESRRRLLTEFRPLIVKAVRAKLREDRPAALAMTESLSVAEKKQLFLELVALCAFTHESTERARRLVLSLPREWLLENIEMAAEFQLVTPRSADFEEYRRLLELFLLVDTALTRRFAVRATEHAHEKVREAGAEFLSILEASARRG